MCGGVAAVKEHNTGLFSRPGSGPVVLNGTGDQASRRKNQISVEPQVTTKPSSSLVSQGGISGSDHNVSIFSGKTSHVECEPASNIETDPLRKGSAQSKASNDSGISLEQQQKLLNKPMLASEGGATSPATGLKLDGGEETSLSKPVSRLGSKEILSQLNDIGILPLRTNRCGSSLAFNIDISSSNDVIVAASGDHTSLPSTEQVEHEQLGGSDAISARRGSLPPPNRLARLKTLPPIKISKEEIEAKQQRAEERRKKREEKIKKKSAQLRVRRVSEAELSEREDEVKEKISQDLQQKLIQTEMNKQKLREMQMEKQRKHEERLQRVKINREKNKLNGVGGYGDQIGDPALGEIESGDLEKSSENFEEFDGKAASPREQNENGNDVTSGSSSDVISNEQSSLGTSQGSAF